MYKIKSSWYTKQTTNSDLICQERNVWKLILDNKMDDVKAYFACHADGIIIEETSSPTTEKRSIPLLRKKIDRFSKQLYDNLEAKAKQIILEVTVASAGGTVEELLMNKHNYERPIYNQVLNLEKEECQDQDSYLRRVLQVLVEYVLKQTEKKNTFESVARPLGGNIYFY